MIENDRIDLIAEVASQEQNLVLSNNNLRLLKINKRNSGFMIKTIFLLLFEYKYDLHDKKTCDISATKTISARTNSM